MPELDGAHSSRNGESDLRDPFMDGLLWFFGSELIFWIGLGALFLLFGNRLT
jgi:hypothetical protein